MSTELRHLPGATQSKLRSSQILTSLPQLVSELIQNSLDAGAGHVEIGVDCEEWSCWVKDDGSGMSKSDLSALLTAGRYGEFNSRTILLPWLSSRVQAHPKRILQPHYKKLRPLVSVEKVRSCFLREDALILTCILYSSCIHRRPLLS